MSQLKTYLLLSMLTLLVLYTGYAFIGIDGLIVAGVISIVMNVGMYWLSDSIVLSSVNAKPYDLSRYPGMQQYVSGYCEMLQIPMPRFYLMQSVEPNAFATGRDPAHAVVCISTGLLSLLTFEEQVGVIVHELGHIKNRDTLLATVGALLTGILSFIANISYFGSIDGENQDSKSPIGWIIATLIAPLSGALLFYAISRTREYEADVISAKTVRTAEPLISALKKIGAFLQSQKRSILPAHTQTLCIVSSFSLSDTASLFSTHPPLHKRIEKLLQWQASTV